MRPRNRRIRAVIVLDHPLRPSLYHRPNEGADNGAADDPANNVPRDRANDHARTNANCHPNVYVSPATKHRPASVIEQFVLRCVDDIDIWRAAKVLIESLWRPGRNSSNGQRETAQSVAL